MFLGDNSAAHRNVRRRDGLGSPPTGSCCADCADTGLGDLSSIAAVVTQSKALDWLFVFSLSIGAVAGALSIYDHLRKRRRRYRPRRTARTMQIPVQSMHDLVYGERDAA